ncbi:hypothetical protein PFISCL1PPCAC_27737, partial [Pristionchus fissidentatus]
EVSSSADRPSSPNGRWDWNVAVDLWTDQTESGRRRRAIEEREERERAELAERVRVERRREERRREEIRRRDERRREEEMRIAERQMDERDSADDWDEWIGDGTDDHFSFGPNGEYVDMRMMSQMDVGTWSDSEWFNKAVAPPKKVVQLPKEMVNETHFARRIVRHFRFVKLLDAVKEFLNQYYAEPPEGMTKDLVLEEIRVWKQFAVDADNMKGDLRITGQTADEVTYLDGIKKEYGRMSIAKFQEMMKAQEEFVLARFSAFSDHFSSFLSKCPTKFNVRTHMATVLEAIDPKCTVMTAYDANKPRHFSRTGGLDSGLGLDFRCEWRESHVKLYLDLLK